MTSHDNAAANKLSLRWSKERFHSRGLVMAREDLGWERLLGAFGTMHGSGTRKGSSCSRRSVCPVPGHSVGPWCGGQGPRKTATAQERKPEPCCVMTTAEARTDFPWRRRLQSIATNYLNGAPEWLGAVLEHWQ